MKQSQNPLPKMKILFLCTSNIHRSLTAEHYFRVKYPQYEFRSAGLSQKYCKKHGSKLCTTEMLEWADNVFVMEQKHTECVLAAT